MVAHKGRSTHDGHYVAFVRDESPGAPPDRWLVWDDSALVAAVTFDARVRPLDGLPGVFGLLAYFIIYRATSKPLGYSSTALITAEETKARGRAPEGSGGGGVRKRIRKMRRLR